MAGATSRHDTTKLLPTEMVTKVLDNLKSVDIVALSQTCRRLRTIASTHGRFWHKCILRAKLNDPTDLKFQRWRFVKRVRALVALGSPISIVLRFWYDPDFGDTDSDGDGGYKSRCHPHGPLALSNDSGTKTWRKAIRFALSPEIAPRVTNFDLELENMYAVLAYNDLAQAEMSALRRLRLRLCVGFGARAPIPGAFFGKGAPQLREVRLIGVSFNLGSQHATVIIPAFANVTTASLLNIDMAYLYDLALFLPNVVHLTLGPTTMYDLDEEMVTTRSKDCLSITPFGASLKTLHLECMYGWEGDKCYLTLAHLIHGLVPHLCEISVEGLEDTFSADNAVLLIDGLVGAFGPTTRIALQASYCYEGIEFDLVHLTVDAFVSSEKLFHISAAMRCYDLDSELRVRPRAPFTKKTTNRFWPKVLAALQLRSSDIAFTIPTFTLDPKNKGLAQTFKDLGHLVPSVKIKTTAGSVPDEEELRLV